MQPAERRGRHHGVVEAVTHTVEEPRAVVLGRVPASALRADTGQPVGDVAEPGPKTFRPHHSADSVAKQLAKKELEKALQHKPSAAEQVKIKDLVARIG